MICYELGHNSDFTESHKLIKTFFPLRGDFAIDLNEWSEFLF
jgi:hypothetical protein